MMKCMIFGLAIATLAGFVSLTSGHGLLSALLIYSVAGQIAMLTAAGAVYVHGRMSA